MALTALNRSTVALLTNQSGGSVAQGDVVIIDSANASSFTTTTTGAYASGFVGVVLEPNGIASTATGLIAFGGYVPKVNLSASASLGDLFKTHTVVKQAVRHAGPIVSGDVGEVLATGTTPAALLWGQPASSGTTAAAELGYVQVTANQTGISATVATDLTSLTLTVTVGTRAIIVEFGCWQVDAGSSIGAISMAYLIDVTGSAQIAQQSLNTGDGSGQGASLKVRVAPSAGSRTYKVQAKGDGTSTGRVLASSTQPAWLRIYEV